MAILVNCNQLEQPMLWNICKRYNKSCFNYTLIIEYNFSQNRVLFLDFFGTSCLLSNLNSYFVQFNIFGLNRITFFYWWLAADLNQKPFIEIFIQLKFLCTLSCIKMQNYFNTAEKIEHNFLAWKRKDYETVK